MKLQIGRGVVLALIGLMCGSCGKKDLDRGEKGSVRAAYFNWIDEVEGSRGITNGVVDLYAQDAILMPTLRSKICDTPRERNDYFIFFLSLKNLQVQTIKLITREYGEIAMNTGFYNVSFEDDQGEIKTVYARFDFWYKKIDGKWKIIFHQSSVLPAD